MSKNAEESHVEKQDSARRFFLKKEPITPQEEGVGRKFGPSVSRRRPNPKPRPRKKKEKD